MDTDLGAASYRRFLDGDERGFDEILRLYHDGLIFFINGIVHQYETAEDLAADTFMELLVHKNRYRFKSSFKTYLFSIARHKAIDHIRREARHGSVSTDDQSIREIAGFESIEETIVGSDEKRRILSLIQTLPEDYAAYLHLVYFQDLTPEEAGVVMKKSKKQMANLAYRAKKALEEAMREGGSS